MYRILISFVKFKLYYYLKLTFISGNLKIINIYIIFIKMDFVLFQILSSQRNVILLKMKLQNTLKKIQKKYITIIITIIEFSVLIKYLKFLINLEIINS